MFRIAATSRSGRPPESRSTTFPTALIQTQCPSCRRMRYSAWWNGVRPARQAAQDASRSGRSSGWIAASHAARPGGVVPGGLPTTSSHRSVPSISPVSTSTTAGNRFAKRRTRSRVSERSRFGLVSG